MIRSLTVFSNLKGGLVGALLSAACFVTGASAASAQDTAVRRPATVIELPRETIYGRRQAPGAEFVMTRSRGSYEVRELRASFVGSVVRTVRSGPF